MKWTVAASAIALGFVATQARAKCELGNGIKHVVYMQFDNTHYLRDTPAVPSDLEQMPNLLNYVISNGMLLANDHTQLISHTGNGLITSISGLYPDRTGAGAISNSFYYYNSATNLPSHSGSTFVYWTDKLNADVSSTGAPNPGADTSYVLVGQDGKNTPAPWAAYTKAGCDFGAIGIADMDLENTNSDLATVYGTSSPEYAEGTSTNSTTSNQAVADFEGIALHCAKGSEVCAAANALAGETPALSKVVPDILPEEPGGYDNFQGLFGHKYVVPALQKVLGQTPNGVLNDLSGGPIGYLTVGVSNGQPTSVLQNGFPGFDGTFPKVTLAYAATMLEAGVPIVYGYFSDAHDHHYATADGVNPEGSDFAYGPGEQGYVNQLAQYNEAFGQFFARLKADGIDQSNTLFVILVEEGDKFTGAAGVPAGCDGVSVACTYPPIATTGSRASKGEVDVNVNTLLGQQRNDTTAFSVHSDQGPAFWLNGDPGQTDAATRQFERDLLAVTAQDPYRNNQSLPLLTYIVDQPMLKLLHQVTGDPLRTPTAVGYAYDDFYAGVGTVTNSLPGCSGQAVCTNPEFAWNHGGTSGVVRQTWSSMVGPGVKPVGVDSTTWADHTDTRATMFALLGLQDPYEHDGRVIVENLAPAALSPGLTNDLDTYKALAVAYKQLTAPFGAAGLAGLQLSTFTVGSGVAGVDDSTYLAYRRDMQIFLAARDKTIKHARTLLSLAELGVPIDRGDALATINGADALISQIQGAAASAAAQSSPQKDGQEQQQSTQ